MKQINAFVNHLTLQPLVSSKKNTVKSTFSAHIQFKPVNNWDLITIEKLLLVILK